MLSSREEPITKSDAFGAGANDYLVKLPDRLELLARIRYHSRGYTHLLERNEAYEALRISQEALAKDLALAADYAMSILPAPIARQDLRTSWKFIPSARLGGDSFGYQALDDDHFAMYLLDVCDHGVGPALLSVSVINVLRSQNLNRVDFRDPSAVLAALNDTFPMEQNNNLYFTLWYGVYHRPSRMIRFAAGGHPPALLFAPDGTSTELGARGMVVGGMAGAPYAAREVEVPPGATLYVFSDGVYEIARPGGRVWELEEFAEYLGRLRAEAPEDLFAALYAHVLAMRGTECLDDDFSIMEIAFDAHTPLRHLEGTQ